MVKMYEYTRHFFKILKIQTAAQSRNDYFLSITSAWKSIFKLYVSILIYFNLFRLTFVLFSLRRKRRRATPYRPY